MYTALKNDTVKAFLIEKIKNKIFSNHPGPCGLGCGYGGLVGLDRRSPTRHVTWCVGWYKQKR